MANSREVAAARDSLRAQNQNAVFHTIHRHGPISRADIAAHLSLSPATVTNIAGALIERRLVYEARQATEKRAGRPAILLEIDYDHALVAGIKISRSALTCAVTNLNAEVVQAETFPLGDSRPETVVAEVERALAVLTSGRRLVAIGVSLPGIVDIDRITVRHSSQLGWEGIPFGTLLAERLALPVLVENDVNALALAEAWFGSGRDQDSMLVVTLGRGVGLGIVLGGEVYRGPHGGAGEFGHILLDPSGPESRYSRRGTLESYLSDDALLRDAAVHVDSLPADADNDTLVALARGGDAEAIALYHRAGRIFGHALSLLINIFAPNLLVLGGEGLRAAEFLLPAAREALAEASFGDLAERLELVVDPWGDDAWARGAAGLAASRYLTESVMRLGGDRTGRRAQ